MILPMPKDFLENSQELSSARKITFKAAGLISETEPLHFLSQLFLLGKSTMVFCLFYIREIL